LLKIRNKPGLLVGSSLVPLTFGMHRAMILLPPACAEWTETRRRAVLVHELAHVQRRDTLAQLFANVITCLWWFQPFCWLCRRSLRDESEQACDELVIQSGVKRSDYAAELLALARLRAPGRFASCTLTMARRHGLPARIRFILCSSTQARSFAPTAVAFVLLGVLAVTATAVTVGPQPFNRSQGGLFMKKRIFSGLLASIGLSAATIGGSVYDSGGATIADAKSLSPTRISDLVRIR
jgi:beta-lactamase regulating signal transducer with metallopeptidase domain